MKQEFDKSDEKLKSFVKNNGWYVIKVLEEENEPRFAYSVGLYKTFGHPEIIFIGLPHDVTHILGGF